MLKRKITQKFIEWKKSKTSQALLVMGARQVGKTTSIRNFGLSHYENIAEVNFFQNASAVETIAAAQDAADLLLRISALSRTEMKEGSTLIFLDEIQECENLLTLLKFLMEETSYDVIMSGSLLGLDNFPARSLPVGFLQTLTLYPLDFEEFCMARAVPGDVMQVAKDCFKQKNPVPDYVHDMLMREFYLYLLVGGMPDATQAFVETNTLAKTRNAQKGIVDVYEYDITKYVADKTERRQIEMVYEAIPKQLSSENKRFKYTRLSKNLRYSNIETAFDWLECSGIALLTERVTEPLYPLKASANPSNVKIFMNDVGLLTSQLMGDVDIDILNRRASMNYGSIFENVCAQELRAHGYNLYYYRSSKQGEVDFVLEDKRGDISLCEIKSGKDYKRHNALNNLLSTPNYSFAKSYVFCDGNLHEEENALYLPIYMIDFLHYE